MEESGADINWEAAKPLLAFVLEQMRAGLNKEQIAEQLLEKGPEMGLDIDQEIAAGLVEAIHADVRRLNEKQQEHSDAEIYSDIAPFVKEHLRERGLSLPRTRKERADFLEPLVRKVLERSSSYPLDPQVVRQLAEHFARYPRIAGIWPLEP